MRGAEAVDPLVLGDDRHPPLGDAGDDLLAEQRAPPPLDHPKLGVDLVGAVDVEIERRDVVDVPERHAHLASQFGGRLAGRHGDEFEMLVPDALAQPTEHQRGRRSGPQPNGHPRLDQLGRRSRRPSLRGIIIL